MDALDQGSDRGTGCRQGDASTDLRPANADEYDLVVHTKEEELGTRRRVPNEDFTPPKNGTGHPKRFLMFLCGLIS